VLLGEVAQGQQVSKKIIVRGRKPFRILSIQCADEDCFQFKTDDQSSDRHIVEIIFNAKKDAGKVKEAIQIATDLGDKFHAGVTAYATIVPAAPAAPATAANDSAATPAAGTPGDAGKASAAETTTGAGTASPASTANGAGAVNAADKSAAGVARQ
jgi:hypothetical protein